MKWHLLFLSYVLALFLSACANKRNNPVGDNKTPPTVREITFNEAKGLADRMARFADQRSWFELEQLFASRVVYDFGSPELLTPTQVVVASWLVA